MGRAFIGESLLSALIDAVLHRLTSPTLLRFFRWQELEDGLLGRLKKTMNNVSALLHDAEEQQIAKEAVKNWLLDVLGALYEADDLLDDMDYEGWRLELEATSQNPQNQVRSFSSSLFTFNNRMKMGHETVRKLENILERLDDLVKQNGVLNLIEGTDIDGRNPFSPKTSSLGNGFSVYGRENDRETMMKLLLSVDEYGGKVGVISIVGVSGVGKTTLARLVHKDHRVQEWFDVRMWVRVGLQFDVSSVTKDILWEIGDRSLATDEHDQLLKEKLKEKKFLLVLDNVWQVQHLTFWEKFLYSLRSGAQGSKIIVTTRDVSVATLVQTVKSPYHLKGILDDDSWLLFAEHAFSGGNSSCSLQLEQTGKEIVKKCKGLPLAIKTVGCLMRSSKDLSEWEKVSKSSMWSLVDENVPSACRLCYYYLPSHLKRCFAYCAIFPKGHSFKKEEVILLWMAEGFLVHPKGIEKTEEIEIGENYFDHLVSMSFFQESDEDSSCFFMHDVIHDLAQTVSKEVCISLVGDESCKASRRTRHLSDSRIRSDSIYETFESMHEGQTLRTFLSKWRGTGLDDEAFHDLLCCFNRLRVLSLPFHYKITHIPDTIGMMKHLRYLNLSNTWIIKLPETVATLYNLQTLILHACQCLRELPMNMMNMIDLCYLDIRGTSLEDMPPQIGKLIKLQRLTDFFVGKHIGSSIKELGNLKQLQGKLCLWNLQNVVDVEDVLEANLKGKKKLKRLKLRWDGDNDDSRDEKVLEHLQPHSNVECLKIFGYRGTKFPDWVGNYSFSNIVFLKLSECNHCCFLPPLGQLSSLKNLCIEDFDAVMTIGPEFYGSCSSVTQAFRSLEILGFERLPYWQQWISSVSNFPVLQKLYIRDCPNLIEALPDGLSSLTELEIWGCQKLVVSLPWAPSFHTLTLKDESRYFVLNKLPSGAYSLTISKFQSKSLLKEMEQMDFPETFEELCVSYCDLLEFFGLELLNKSKHLKVHRCPNLLSLNAESPLWDCTFASLTSLSITECRNLVSFVKGGLAAPNLRQLHLEGCSKLKMLPEFMSSLLPSLVNLEIISCPELESFPEGGLPEKLQSLAIYDSNKLIAGRRQWGLQRLPSLSHFSIGMCREVKSFPERTLLPSTIASLSVFQLTNLKSLDYKGLQHLTSLRKLAIRGCPQLQSMREEGLPSTLEYLKIWDLPNLEGLDYEWLSGLASLRKVKIWECPKCHSMPKQGLPSSVSSLSIYDCPLLEQRCQREKGAAWPKISHIPLIKFQR